MAALRRRTKRREEEEGKEKEVELPRFGAVLARVEEKVSLERTSIRTSLDGRVEVYPVVRRILREENFRRERSKPLVVKTRSSSKSPLQLLPSSRFQGLSQPSPSFQNVYPKHHYPFLRDPPQPQSSHSLSDPDLYACSNVGRLATILGL